MKKVIFIISDTEGGKKAKMNITTAANNFTTGLFSGEWTPNHKD